MRAPVVVLAVGETAFAVLAFVAFCSGINRDLFFAGLAAICCRGARLVVQEMLS